MKKVIDKFSTGSDEYRKYRPHYPEELYHYLLDLTAGREVCWDCATGNGQVAQALAPHFHSIQATDISASQLAEAYRLPNVTYSLQRAEQTNFADQSIDLITVGQALHWFDFAAFNQEVVRVLRPGGVLAVWCYRLLHVNPPLDEKILELYDAKLGNYWSEERRHVDAGYADISLPFPGMATERLFETTLEWSAADLVGYLNTWSSVKKYQLAFPGSDPVGEVMNDHLREYGGRTFKVHIPIVLRWGEKATG